MSIWLPCAHLLWAASTPLLLLELRRAGAALAGADEVEEAVGDMAEEGKKGVAAWAARFCGGGGGGGTKRGAEEASGSGGPSGTAAKTRAVASEAEGLRKDELGLLLSLATKQGARRCVVPHADHPERPACGRDGE